MVSKTREKKQQTKILLVKLCCKKVFYKSIMPLAYADDVDVAEVAAKLKPLSLSSLRKHGVLV